MIHMLKNKQLIRDFSALILLLFIIINGFPLIEAVAASAASTTVTTTATGSGNAVSIGYGVELTTSAELALTCDAGTSTLASIPGLTGGSSTVTKSCMVKTNGINGWVMTAKASTSPALINSASSTVNIPDVVGAGTPAAWPTVAVTSSEFGINVTGTYSPSSFSGSKYAGFNGTNAITIGSNTSPTTATGEMIYMNYRVDVGNAGSQPTGLYQGRTIITAYMN